MQNQADADRATLLNTSTVSPHENLPEYVEAAAREIHNALSTFLLTPTILNPNGGPPLPWVSEIRIPAAVETNKTTGKVYTNVEAAWFDTDGIDDIAAELASRWCQPPELLGQLRQVRRRRHLLVHQPNHTGVPGKLRVSVTTPKDRHRPRRRHYRPVLATDRRRRTPQRHHHRCTPQRREQHYRRKGKYSQAHC